MCVYTQAALYWSPNPGRWLSVCFLPVLRVPGCWSFRAPGQGVNGSAGVVQEMMASGLSFVDTAEVYGYGRSEELVRQFAEETQTSPVIATKFAPMPWRLTSSSVVSACRASLARCALLQL